MLTYMRKEMNTPKTCQVDKKDVFQLLWHLQVDQRSLFWTSQHQVWILQQDDTFGNC